MSRDFTNVSNEFAQGVLAGLEIAGVSCPFDSTQTHLCEGWAMRKLISKELADFKEAVMEAKLIFERYGFPEQDFRAMIFDVADINDNCVEIDEFGHEVGAAAHRSWPLFKVIAPDGRSVSIEGYDALIPSEQAKYKKVRYFELEGYGRIFEDDEAFMAAAFELEDAIGDNIILRYLSEKSEMLGSPYGFLIRRTIKSQRSHRFAEEIGPVDCD